MIKDVLASTCPEILAATTTAATQTDLGTVEGAVTAVIAAGGAWLIRFVTRHVVAFFARHRQNGDASD